MDEGVPKGLTKRLRDLGPDVSPFPNDWKQLANGALLTRIELAGFDVLITNDKRMQFQQNVGQRHIAIVVLPTNIRVDVYGMVSEIAEAVADAAIGKVFRMERVSARMRAKPFGPNN